MDDRAILELQAQLRQIRKQMAQVKKAMKESPSFDDMGLDIIIYLR